NICFCSSNLKKQLIHKTGVKEINIRAVLCCPVSFNDVQKEATLRAAQYAGIDVVKLIPEPTAAFYFYGIQKHAFNIENDITKKDTKVPTRYPKMPTEINEGIFLTFDFGGGTLDTTVAQLKNSKITFLAVNGDPKLGGIDIDLKLTEIVKMRWKKEDENRFNTVFFVGKKLTPSNEKILKRREYRLRKLVEKAKIALSIAQQSVVDLSEFYCGVDIDDDVKTPNIAISKEDIEIGCKNIFQRCLNLVAQTLLESKVPKNKLTKILLVGGSSQMPYVQTLLEKEYGKIVLKDCDCNVVVAEGAALYCRNMALHGETNVNEITCNEIEMSGVDSTNKKVVVPIIEKGTKIPFSNTFPVFPIRNDVIVELYENKKKIGVFVIDKIQKKTKNELFECEVKINTFGILEVKCIGENRCAVNVDRERIQTESEDMKKKKDYIESFLSC
ncbi:DnaK family protein, partial [Entamoeba invadens IP1]